MEEESWALCRFFSDPSRVRAFGAATMLDYFTIFTLGGDVLWSYEWNALIDSPINAFVEQCLIEQSHGTRKKFTYKSYTIKWEQNNELGLVFVAVHRSMLTVPYVENLLRLVRNRFEYVFRDAQADYGEFSETFQEVLARCEAEQATTTRGGSDGSETDESGGDGDGEDDDSASFDIEKDAVMVERPVEDALEGLSVGNGDQADAESPEVKKGFDTGKLKALRKKRAGKASSASAAATKKPSGSGSSAPKQKGRRKWGLLGEPETEQQLDFTDGGDAGRGGPAAPVERATGRSLMDDDDNDDGGAVAAAAETGWLGGMMKTLNKKINVSGQAVLEESDVRPILEALKEKLVSKNVAEEVAQKVVDVVESNVVGSRLESFTRVATAVTRALEDALTKILSPGRNINILQEVEACRRDGEPYSIVFIGCNGVGKSTNLAKVAFWLMQHGMKVMIAACDTFRSGAVEQLRTHTQRLGMELFERGYEKDPAAVAREALKKAKEEGCDVVLVDTAGRMQDNEPLMRALSKLINTNSPNLTLFVGEALVGNEAVDQLTKFNSRLIELSPVGQTHKIDGILLTKWDAVEEKVGAALSMVYISGAPVVFIGVGQQYGDLRRLNVKQIVSVLLK